MRSSHTAAATSVRFDDPNLVSCAGLLPVMRLAGRVGLGELADRHVRLGGPTGANAGSKVTSIVAGMLAGADSITDLDVLRHGALPRVLPGGRAASTLGAFLRWFTPGHVGQLDIVAREVLAGLCARTPILPGVEQQAFLDIDAKITRVYGTTKQGARYGHTNVRGFNTLAATLSTPAGRPVIVGSRLRGGNANDARHAASFVRHAQATARACGATGPLTARMDSAFYNGEIITIIRNAGARFSVTIPQRRPVLNAITAIAQDAWQPINHDIPIPEHDSPTGAPEIAKTPEIAETTYTAFTNPTLNPGQKTTARLIVVRTRIPTPPGHDALFPVYRYHAIFTDTTLDILAAITQHHGRCGSVEHVFADLNAAALAHFPSGRFSANAAWLTLASIAYNLTRATGALAGGRHTTARTSTIRRQLINVAARISRSARRITLHLPQHWPWQQAWQHLFIATHAPLTPT